MLPHSVLLSSDFELTMHCSMENCQFCFLWSRDPQEVKHFTLHDGAVVRDDDHSITSPISALVLDLKKESPFLSPFPCRYSCWIDHDRVICVNEPSYHASQFPFHFDSKMESISVVHQNHQLSLFFNDSCVLTLSLPAGMLLEDDCYCCLLSACNGLTVATCHVQSIRYTAEVRETLVKEVSEDHDEKEMVGGWRAVKSSTPCSANARSIRSWTCAGTKWGRMHVVPHCAIARCVRVKWLGCDRAMSV